MQYRRLNFLYDRKIENYESFLYLALCRNLIMSLNKNN